MLVFLFSNYVCIFLNQKKKNKEREIRINIFQTPTLSHGVAYTIRGCKSLIFKHND